MWEGMRRFITDQAGLEVVEYSILVGLLVAAVIATIAAVGSWVAGVYNSVRATLGA
jgi:pilus assembly protein Flp/PilA